MDCPEYWYRVRISVQDMQTLQQPGKRLTAHCFCFVWTCALLYNMNLICCMIYIWYEYDVHLHKCVFYMVCLLYMDNVECEHISSAWYKYVFLLLLHCGYNKMHYAIDMLMSGYSVCEPTHIVMITSSLRQSDVGASFWRYSNVIITSCGIT